MRSGGVAWQRRLQRNVCLPVTEVWKLSVSYTDVQEQVNLLQSDSVRACVWVYVYVCVCVCVKYVGLCTTYVYIYIYVYIQYIYGIYLFM
jgi:hypothetical protein